MTPEGEPVRGADTVVLSMGHRNVQGLAFDDEGLAGRLRILRVLSRTNAPFSQGPVWREDGRAV